MSEIEVKVHNLESMLNYQEGSTVSRTLIQQKNGTITLFAFDEGEHLSEHTAPFDALVHVLDGQVLIAISGKPFTLNRGEMIIMPANQPHSLKALSRFKMLLAMVKTAQEE